MTNDGPTDSRFRIPGGTLQFNAERDTHFPYIYRIPTHALVHAPEYIKTIWIHIVDTSTEARMARANFEKSLSVPLGPNAFMDTYGLFPNLMSLLYLISFIRHRFIGTGTGYNIVRPAAY